MHANADPDRTWWRPILSPPSPAACRGLVTRCRAHIPTYPCKASNTHVTPSQPTHARTHMHSHTPLPDCVRACAFAHASCGPAPFTWTAGHARALTHTCVCVRVTRPMQLYPFPPSPTPHVRQMTHGSHGRHDDLHACTCVDDEAEIAWQHKTEITIEGLERKRALITVACYQR